MDRDELSLSLRGNVPLHASAHVQASSASPRISPIASVPEVHTCSYKCIFYVTREITGEYAEWLRLEIMHRQQTTAHKRL